MPEPITGPESLIPGKFYRNSTYPRVLYLAVGWYWKDPVTGERVPQPGSEAMIVVTGDVPGALVAAPGEGGWCA